MKIGILNGGGDCPGLNAVIRGVVKTAYTKYGDTIFGIKNAFQGLIGEEKIINLTPFNIRGILHEGGTILYSSNQDDPFRYPFKVGDKIVQRDISDDVVAKIKELGIDCLICVGGDGTLSIAKQFMDKGVNIIGVPKTIDNDLEATDLTFGFRTAVNTATEALDKLHTTAASHHRIMIVEVMGRNAGWIALETGMAGGADIILIPEIPYDINKIVEKIESRRSHGSGFSIIVVAEGAKPLAGDLAVVGKNKLGYDILGGAGHRLQVQLQEKVNVDIRTTVLGHIQRGGSPISSDRILATRFGIRAMELAHEKQYGRMVCLKGTSITSCPLGEALSKMKGVDPDGEYVRDAESIHISFGR